MVFLIHTALRCTVNHTSNVNSVCCLAFRILLIFISVHILLGQFSWPRGLCVDLKPFDCRDPNCVNQLTVWLFISCVCLCCVGSDLCDGVITRSEDFYCVCVCVCVCVFVWVATSAMGSSLVRRSSTVCVFVCVCGLETSRMRRTRPEWVLLCHIKRLPSLTNTSRQQQISFHNKTSHFIHNIVENGKVYGISNPIFLTGNEPVFLNDKIRSLVVVRGAFNNLST